MAFVAWSLARRRCPSLQQVVSFQVTPVHLGRPIMGASQKDFENAMTQVKLLKDDPGNEVKLKLYALYKQATEGPCNVPKPGVFDFINKAKWDAWNALGSLPKETARQNYVDLVTSLSPSEASSQGEPGVCKKVPESDGIVVTSEDGITKITFNRPTKKNAITLQMYDQIIQALKTASMDNSSITVFTGNGDYFSSGNDLTNFTSFAGEMEEAAKHGAVMLRHLFYHLDVCYLFILPLPEIIKKEAEIRTRSPEFKYRDFVNTFIDFPKPLIAMVNGPAVGIAVTILGLFDAVYATDKATFHTPFSSLNQTPEACSSYTFPKIMGPATANEVLIFGRKLTAKEAWVHGLVTEVFPESTFEKEVWTRLKAYAKLPPNAMRISKELIRKNEKEKLYAVNAEECTTMQGRWLSEECIRAVMSFMSRKSKL